MATDNQDLRPTILTNELGNRMLDMVAPIYDNSAIALYLFNAIGNTLSKDLYFVNEDFIKQIYPQTATWGLKYFEEEYGIITDESKSIEQRRNHFIGLRFNRPPMTPKRIATIVSNFTGFECEVKELGANTIRVIIYGYPKNIKSVQNLLDEKTPAHLFYEIKGIERLEVTHDNYPVVIGKNNLSERVAEIEVKEYKNETVERIGTTAYVFRAMASGNIAEKYNEIEVVN